MPADVWIKIQDYERVFATKQHEILLVVLDVARDAAENALIRL
jgi:hypothetical protein